MRHAVIAGRTRHLKGWRRSPKTPGHMVGAHPALEALALTLPPAASIELFSLVPVFDQGQTGDCTAHMGCEQIGFLELKAGSHFVNFSRLFLYAVTRQLEGTPLEEDSGAEIHDVMAALTSSGVCTDTSWPTGNGSSYMIEPTQSARADASEHKALLHYHCPTLATVKASIVQGFPVGFGFSVPANMQTEQAAATGEVHYPQPGEEIVGGHAVVAIGYDDHKVIGEETGAVLCRNSWSVDWGASGDFWLPQRYWTDQLADDCHTLRAAAL